MKCYKFIDQAGYHVLSENDIIHQYYPYWQAQMEKKFGSFEPSEDSLNQCIDDFVVVHWAWEVESWELYFDKEKIMDQDLPSPEQVNDPIEKATYAGRALNRRLTVREQVDQQIRELENRLKALKVLKEKLDRVPDVEELLNAMRSLGI